MTVTMESVSMVTVLGVIMILLLSLTGISHCSDPYQNETLEDPMEDMEDMDDMDDTEDFPQFRLGAADRMSAEKLLVNALLRNYSRIGKIGRPVVNVSTPVVVLFGLGLIQLEVDEKDNMLTLSTWVRYQWKDEYLTWDPEDYDGVQIIRLPHKKLWTPDIMLYNTANTEEYVRSALVVVTHEGVVRWYPHRLYQSSCSFDVRNFPFDNQTCHLAFGSWTQTLQELDLQLAFPEGVDLSTFQSDYKDSSKWEITGIEASRQMVDSTYGVLSFTIKLRRKLMFSSYILTVPAVFLAFLTLIVFVLPADDVEKTVLGLTIFGSLLLLLLILVEAAPPTAAAVPLLGLFYCFTTVIVILSVFLSSFVVKLGNTDKRGRRRRVSPLIKKIMFHGVAKILWMEPLYEGGPRCREPVSDTEDTDDKAAARAGELLALNPHVYPAGDCPGNGDTVGPWRPNITSYPELQSSVCDALHGQLRAISVILETISSRQETREAREAWEAEIHSEWKYLASVLDRLFFLLYFIAIVVSLGVLFPRP